jgi:hypothetical protein
MRVLSRVALLSLAAVVFVGLTGMYGRSVRPSLPDRVGQAERQHRASQPRISQFPEFIGYVFLLLFFAGIGRIAFRLRLSPPPRNEGQPILLGLHGQNFQSVGKGVEQR